MPTFARAIALFLILVSVAGAQPALTGNVAVDFSDVMAAFPEDSAQTGRTSGAREPSPWLAGTLSGLLPGTGQLYAGAPLWRSLLYGGIEVGAVTTYVLMSGRGNELTEEFESYADRHWSVVRYVQWIERNLERWPDERVNRVEARRALATIYRDTPAGAPDWERIDFSALARLERAILSGFSHTLPEHGRQQYYEQLGKYAQYRAGWDDHDLAGDTLIYDPSHVTARNIEYMEMRARANDRLAWAGAALGVVVLNHLVSMLDAVLTARAFNAKLTLHPHPELGADYEFGVTVGLAVNF